MHNNRGPMHITSQTYRVPRIGVPGIRMRPVTRSIEIAVRIISASPLAHGGRMKCALVEKPDFAFVVIVQTQNTVVIDTAAQF